MLINEEWTIWYAFAITIGVLFITPLAHKLSLTLRDDWAVPLKLKDSSWRVIRCAAKDKSLRTKQGGYRSSQRKVECSDMDVRSTGVSGSTRRWLWGPWVLTRQMEDFNAYRTRGGDSGEFEPRTINRAVSIVTVHTYDELRRKLPECRIHPGDLGENLLLMGPSLKAGVDLNVGMRLRIGDKVQLEITEANKPCHRLNFLPWAHQAERRFGAAWWNHPDMPTCPETSPGGRGWLAKVVVEGRLYPMDLVAVVS